MWNTVAKLVPGVLVTLACGVPCMAQQWGSTGRRPGMFSGGSFGRGGSSVQHQWLTTGAGGQLGADAVQRGGRGRQRTGYRQTGAFVGADRQDLESFFQRLGRASRDGYQDSSGVRSFRRQGQRPEQSALDEQGTPRGGSSTPAVRTRLRVAFDYLPPSDSKSIEALAKNLSRLDRTGAASPIEVQVQNGTATLRGVVASEHDRRLAEQLARLEPGIRRVQNEVEVRAIPAQPDSPLDRPLLEEPE